MGKAKSCRLKRADGRLVVWKDDRLCCSEFPPEYRIGMTKKLTQNGSAVSLAASIGSYYEFRHTQGSVFRKIASRGGNRLMFRENHLAPEVFADTDVILTVHCRDIGISAVVATGIIPCILVHPAIHGFRIVSGVIAPFVPHQTIPATRSTNRTTHARYPGDSREPRIPLTVEGSLPRFSAYACR